MFTDGARAECDKHVWKGLFNSHYFAFVCVIHAAVLYMHNASVNTPTFANVNKPIVSFCSSLIKVK